MRIAYAVLLLAACGDDTNMFPVGGGGTDGGGTGDGNRPIDARLVDAKVSDAAPTSNIDANIFQGRVCLLTDPRKMDQCANTGADNITVRLGTASTVTQADGTFFIAGQPEANLVWRITGPTIKSSYEVLRDYQIPAMTKTMFDSLKTANNVMEVAGEGSVFVEVTRDGAGLSASTATVNPIAFYTPFYDGATATAWTKTSTSTNGAIWVPGADVGNLTIVVKGTGPDQQVAVPIFDDGITWLNVNFN